MQDNRKLYKSSKSIVNRDTSRVQFYGSEDSFSELLKFRLREAEAGGFNLTETRLPPNQKIPEHAHANASFCFILAGSFTEKYGGRAKEGKPFSMIFSPVNDVHSDNFHNAGGHCFYLEFSPSSLERAREYSLYLDEPLDFQGGEAALISTRLYKEFCWMDESSPLAIEGLALEIMAEVSRRRVRSPEHTPPYWLTQAKDLLHASFAETITAVEVAEIIGVHPVHLARVFRRFNRCTLGEYVRRLRVESASRRLLASDEPLSEIALTTGFSDQAHFSRTFKSQTGLTPAEFRNTFHCR